MKNNIILFDIDYTLFNVGKYRELVFKKLSTFFPTAPDFFITAERTYKEIRKIGWFEAKKFTRQLLVNMQSTLHEEELEAVWGEEALLEKSIYPETKDVLSRLANAGFVLGIFSSGYWNFQKSKIKKLESFFAEEDIHIHEIKDNKLSDVLQKYHGNRVYLVDDYIPVIEHAKKTDSAITTVWIKRGRLSEQVAPSLKSPPDFTIETLDQLMKIVKPV